MNDAVSLTAQEGEEQNTTQVVENTPETSSKEAPATQEAEQDIKDFSKLPQWAQDQLSKARKEAAGYRKQVRTYEEAQAQAKAEQEKNAPLEEKLTLAEERALELEENLAAFEEVTLHSVIEQELIAAGIPANDSVRLRDATRAFLAEIDEIEEEDFEDFTAEAFLKDRPWLLGQQNPTPTVTLGSTRSITDLSQIDDRTIENMTPAEYQQHRSRIFELSRRGQVRK